MFIGIRPNSNLFVLRCQHSPGCSKLNRFVTFGSICLVKYISSASVSMVYPGAGRSSEVKRSLMVRWVVGSILHGVNPLSYFSFQPVLHDWCNKGMGVCYPVCGMVHIKEPLLLIGKSSLCGGSIIMVLNHMSDAI